MKKLLLTIVSIPLFLILIASDSQEMLVNFVASDWESLSTKAQNEGKIYFVDFEANYCATCRHMDKTTYTNTTLAAYMQKNVVATKVDVQDFDGVMWSQQYKVDALPTLLIFNKEGKLIKKIVGYKSATELIQEFEIAKTATLSTPIPSDEALPAQEVPAAYVAPAASIKKAPAKKVQTNNNFFSNAPLVVKPAIKDVLYEINVRKKTATGYAVQVGAFASYGAFMEEAERLSTKFKVKAVLHIDNNAIAPFYKLLLGNFLTRNDAQVFVNQLSKNNTQGLIKDLSKIKNN
jgi:thioredoxin 1